jgi:hypothetical protein
MPEGQEREKTNDRPLSPNLSPQGARVESRVLYSSPRFQASGISFLPLAPQAGRGAGGEGRKRNDFVYETDGAPLSLQGRG